MISNSFDSCVSYDYQTEYSCEESGCNDEGICRCGRIYDDVVKSVSISEMTNYIYNHFIPNSKAGKRHERISQIFYGGEEVDKYCINRIISHFKAWDSSNWIVNIIGGYYGEEIGGVELDKEVLYSISDACDIVLGFETIADKIRFVLTLEYGYILNELKDSDFELISIYKTDIDFDKMNKKHTENVRKENALYYLPDSYSLPRGIVRKLNDRYTIIDGFHRIIVTGNYEFKVFCVK